MYSFRTLAYFSNNEMSQWSPRMLVYGDLGYSNARSLPYIQQEVNNGEVDVIFHNGDIGYELQNASFFK